MNTLNNQLNVNNNINEYEYDNNKYDFISEFIHKLFELRKLFCDEKEKSDNYFIKSDNTNYQDLTLYGFIYDLYNNPLYCDNQYAQYKNRLCILNKNDILGIENTFKHSNNLSLDFKMEGGARKGGAGKKKSNDEDKSKDKKKESRDNSKDIKNKSVDKKEHKNKSTGNNI